MPARSPISYRFLTTWRFPAPIDAVWEAIRDYRTWPSWWESVTRADRVAPGDGEGVGEVVEFEFRTRLPYRLRFRMTTTHVQRPYEIDGEAAGELEGTGRWRLSEAAGETVVQYFWEVRTTRAWMNWLAPIARPLFNWNHDQVMESGHIGLAWVLASRGASAARRV